MEEVIKTSILIIILFLIPLLALSQESINAAGASAKTAEGSISFSLGQIGYNSAYSESGSINMGVQQAYQVTTVSVDDEWATDISLFPNPAIDRIYINTDPASAPGMRYQLFDMQGNLLKSGRLEDAVTPVSLGSLAAATYFIRITDTNRKSKTFQIIKNK